MANAPVDTAVNAGVTNPPQPTPGGSEPMQGKDAGITAAKVRDCYEKGSRAIRPEQYRYAINQSFMRGEQWVYHDPVRNTINEVARDEERVRATVNRLWPSSRIIMAKLLKSELTFEVQPSAADDATIHGAKLGEAVLQHAVDENGWEDIKEQLAWGMWKGGTSVACIEWDANAGGTSLGFNPLTGKEFGIGDVCISALTVAEVCTEPGVRDIERARYWIKAVAMPPEVVRDTYRLPKTPAADSTAAMSPIAQRLIASDNHDGDRIPMTLVLTYFERPSHGTKGGVAVVVGDEIVDEGPWPFPFKDRLNLVCFRETRVASRWTGDTVVTAAVPVQALLNLTEGNIAEHMKLAGNARIMSPMGALDHIDELTDQPGEIIEYVPIGNAQPGFLSPPQMPQWWIEQPERLARAMDDILGVHDVSRGAAPPNINSGAGLSILAEQDETPVGGMAKELAHGLGTLGTMVLQIYAVKVTETRSAKVNSPGNVPQVVQWTGKALEGQTTAIVPLDAMMPRSRQASLENAFRMKQIFPNEVTLKLFSKIADLSRFDDFTSDYDPATEKAQRENWELSIGGVCLPATFDDHAKHILSHNAFRMSARYEQLPDDERHIIDQHVQAHETLAAEAQGTMLAKANVSPALAMSPTANATPTDNIGAALGIDPSQGQAPQQPQGTPSTAGGTPQPNVPQGSVPSIPTAGPAAGPPPQ